MTGEDIGGQRFGRLVAISREMRRMSRGNVEYWMCLCDCGKHHAVRRYSLLRGAVRSCGCFQRECSSKLLTKHGELRKESKHFKLVATWAGMKARCQNPKNRAYHNYGGRGIRVCDRWVHGEGGQTGFKCFLDDMGVKPSPEHSIDRIDNDGNYEPSNCRWVDRKTQGQNLRRSCVITFRGERMSVAQACEITGANQTTVYKRLRRGWSSERAITEPRWLAGRGRVASRETSI